MEIVNYDSRNELQDISRKEWTEKECLLHKRKSMGERVSNRKERKVGTSARIRAGNTVDKLNLFKNSRRGREGGRGGRLPGSGQV